MKRIVTALLLLSGALLAQPLRKVPYRDIRPPDILEGPTIQANPNPRVPLAAIIRLKTDEPARVRLDIAGPVKRWSQVEKGFRTDHVIAVIAMRPARRHAIRVTAIDPAGNARTARTILVHSTPALPPDFPPLRIVTSNPPAMEPGAIGFAANFTTIGGGPNGSWKILLDRDGEVLWYFHDPTTGGGTLERLENGNFLMGLGGWELAAEVDPLGNVVMAWAPEKLVGDRPPGTILLATDTLHHEFFALPDEHPADFLALGSEARVYSGYPADEADPRILSPRAKVIGDIVLELRRDGTILRETRLLDLLDPYRICYDGLNGAFWNPVYQTPEFPSVRDWSHANAVIIDPSDGNYIVSLRHQDAIVKIVPGATGPDGVVWILGDPDRWRSPWKEKLLTPVGPAAFEWPFHQHAPELKPNGNLILFDNGNYRVVPPRTPAPSDTWYSRAVEYTIDEANGTLTQAWAFGGPFDVPQNDFYSRFLGDADPLRLTGNVLVTDGGKSNAQGVGFARVVEVTATEPPIPVFEVVIEDLSGQRNWTVYRSEKSGQ